MACISSVCTRFGAQSTTASLSFLNSARPTRSSLSIKPTAVKSSNASGLLHCSFVSSSSLFLSSSSSAFSGSSLGLDLSSRSGLEPVKRRGLVVRAGKKFQLAQTKRNKSRKSLARVHGFRLRMKTTSGRAVLKRRRAKGRWTLCTKSNPNSGKRA